MRTKEDIKRCRDCKHFEPDGMSVIHNDPHIPDHTTVCLKKPKVIHGILNLFHFHTKPGKAACGMFEQK